MGGKNCHISPSNQTAELAYLYDKNETSLVSHFLLFSTDYRGIAFVSLFSSSIKTRKVQIIDNNDKKVFFYGSYQPKLPNT